jgi:hypothetical protein
MAMVMGREGTGGRHQCGSTSHMQQEEKVNARVDALVEEEYQDSSQGDASVYQLQP